MFQRKPPKPLARGWFVGVVVGVAIGVLAALAVGAWVRTIPVPRARPPDPPADVLDLLERQRNMGWNPNQALQVGVGVSVAEPASAPTVRTAREPVLAVDADAPGVDDARKKGGDRYDFFVQAADFADSSEAEDLRAKLAAAGVSAIVNTRSGEGKRRYRVRLGPFPDKDAALDVVDALESKGLDPALVRVAR